MVIEREPQPKDSKIETATINQLDQLSDFLQPIYAATYPNGTTIRREMFDNDVFREHLRDYLASQLTDPRFFLLTARSSDRITGTIGLAFDKDHPEVAEMWGFYVDPDLQEKGFGRVLYKSLMHDERAKKLKRIHLNVAKTSTKAIEFYKKNGFEITGEEEWDWPSWVDKPPKNQYWNMVKKLS